VLILSHLGLGFQAEMSQISKDNPFNTRKLFHWRRPVWVYQNGTLAEIDQEELFASFQ
jgi:hypothetical protein